MKNKFKVLLTMILYVCIIVGTISGCSKKTNDTNIVEVENKEAKEVKSSVVIAISSEPTSLDPCQGWGHGNTPLVQSTLIEYLQNMSFKNDLATAYSLSEDGLKWSFTIREDAHFTNGDKVTASDVAFTFMTAKKSQSSLDLTFLEEATPTGELSIDFILNKPTATFLNMVATIGIVPEKSYSNDYGTSPIGSGPYKFVQWNSGEQILLEVNKDYYGNIPAIEKVTIVFMDEDAAFAAAKSGQVDIALSSASFAANNQIEGYRVEAISTLDNRGFTLPMEANQGEFTKDGFTIGNDVTSNIEIRKALAYAIDRERIVKDAVYGYGDPAYSENDGMPWNNPDVVIQTDLEYAKKLLKDKGWVDSDQDGILEKDGLKAEFSCVYPSGDSLRQAVALAAAEQAKEIGISILVEGTSWDDISKRMFSDGVLMGWGSTDPYTSYSLYHSSNKLRDDYYNPEGFDNIVVDEYIEKAMESRTIEESYQYWKLAQWDDSTGTSMRGDCPWVWLVNIQHVYFVRDGLDIGEQQLHAHGASMTLIQNLKDWKWDN